MKKLSDSPSLLRSTHARVALGLILTSGCSAAASGAFADAGVVDASIADSATVNMQDARGGRDNSEITDVSYTCGFQAESVIAEDTRPGFVSRDGNTIFGLRQAYGDCYAAMEADHAPDHSMDGAVEYIFPAEVCVTIARQESCQPTQLHYIPGGVRNGGGYKTVLNLAPVAFRNFVGLPRDWNAINVAASIAVRHRTGVWYGSAQFNVDWTNPVLSNLRAVRRDNTMDIQFVTNEPGTWGISVAGENTLIEPAIGCDRLNIDGCSTDAYCVLNNGFGRCATQPWGGQVHAHGMQSVTIPFQPVSSAPYALTLHYQDLGGNTASATASVE